MFSWIRNSLRDEFIQKEMTLFQEEVQQMINEKVDKKMTFSRFDAEEVEHLFLPADVGEMRKIPRDSLIQTEVLKIQFLTELSLILKSELQNRLVYFQENTNSTQVEKIAYLDEMRTQFYVMSGHLGMIHERIRVHKDRLVQIDQISLEDPLCSEEVMAFYSEQKEALSDIENIKQVLKAFPEELLGYDGEWKAIAAKWKRLAMKKREGLIYSSDYLQQGLELSLMMLDKIDECFEQELKQGEES